MPRQKKRTDGGTQVKTTITGVNGTVSAIASIIIPGLGQYFNGQKKRSFAFFTLWILSGIGSLVGGLAVAALLSDWGGLLFFFFPLVHLAAGVDAYLQARNISQR